jgi:hypothetical protein
VRRLWIEIRYAIECVGYWIRPYDMLADARRWRWQRRAPCWTMQPERWLAENMPPGVLATSPAPDPDPNPVGPNGPREQAA